MPTLIITVNLECCRCSSKIQKILCCIQQEGEFVIEKIVYEKDKVLVSGPFDADKLSRKLWCKAGRIVKNIEVAKPPPKPDPKPKPEPPPCKQIYPYPYPFPCPQPGVAVQLLKASLWVPAEAAADATTSNTASTCTAETAYVPVPHTTCKTVCSNGTNFV